ncbi:MAG: phospholipid carrier-dependent glycosyltransferase [Candidatus Shapirobacteria bacterium]|nr:phospholipid carrier-dependent glycosyltransferase [Candidatus Shapirobacteria bacterium]
MNKIKIFLISIFFISFIIRVYLSWNYPSLVWDEAALGYNAFSILQTGRDEYGKFLPLILKSFGDYKPGLYAYLAIPFVYILGLNDLSIRLPSIILGSLTPILLYFLICQIDPRKIKLASIATILLAFNPYNIHFSKTAWETNILTFELVLASYYFFKYINTKKNSSLFLSALVFGTTLYTYQASKMISLFLIVILVILSATKDLAKRKLSFFKFFVFPLFIFALPIVYGMFFSQDSNRLKVVSIFSYSRSQQETSQIISESNNFDYLIFHNPVIFYLREISTRYFNHFSTKFLVFEGDWQNARHSAPYIGVLLYPSIIFLVIGFFTSLAKKQDKMNLFFLFWLLLAPILAALTRDIIQPVRSMSFSIPLIYFTAQGAIYVLNFIKNKTFLVFIILTYLLSFIYYSDLYYNHMVKKSPSDFLYGYKQAVTYVSTRQYQYDHIYFTDFYGQPYIFYLFYSQYSPLKYQSQAKLTENISGDTGTVEKIDNIQFVPINFAAYKQQANTLIIISNDEILRQGLDKNQFTALSPINNISTFYAYSTK